MHVSIEQLCVCLFMYHLITCRVCYCGLWLLCLGAHVRSRAYGSQFVCPCVCVCVCVCLELSCSTGEIYAKLSVSTGIMPRFPAFVFANLQNKAWFSSYGSTCSPRTLLQAIQNTAQNAVFTATKQTASYLDLMYSASLT